MSIEFIYAHIIVRGCFFLMLKKNSAVTALPCISVETYSAFSACEEGDRVPAAQTNPSWIGRLRVTQSDWPWCFRRSAGSFVVVLFCLGNQFLIICKSALYRLGFHTSLMSRYVWFRRKTQATCMPWRSCAKLICLRRNRYSFLI